MTRELLETIGVPAMFNLFTDMFSHVSHIPVDLYTDATALQSIGGNLKSGMFSCYMNVITDQYDAEYLKLYAGKSIVLIERLGEHATCLASRQFSKQTSYHYWCAWPDSRVSSFVAFGPDPTLFEPMLSLLPRDCINTITCTLEMAVMVRSQTLPPRVLVEWLPNGVAVRKPIGTNVHTSVGVRGTDFDRKCVDPEFAAYTTELNVLAVDSRVSKFPPRQVSLRPNELPAASSGGATLAYIPQRDVDLLFKRPYFGVKRTNGGRLSSDTGANRDDTSAKTKTRRKEAIAFSSTQCAARAKALRKSGAKKPPAQQTELVKLPYFHVGLKQSIRDYLAINDTAGTMEKTAATQSDHAANMKVHARRSNDRFNDRKASARSKAESQWTDAGTVAMAREKKKA